MYIHYYSMVFDRMGPDQVSMLEFYVEVILTLLSIHDNNKITFLFSIPLECPYHASGALVPSM